MDEIDVSNSYVFIKEEKTDETEPTFPVTGIKQEAGSLSYCSELIHEKQEGKAVVIDNDMNDVGVVVKEEKTDDTESTCGLSHIKQEEEMIIPDDGDQDSLEKLQETNQYDLKTKINMELKSISNASLECSRKTVKLRKHQCPHCEFITVNIVSLERHISAHNTGEEHHQIDHSDDTTFQSNDIELSHHKEENPLQCPHCEYKAAYPSKVKRHMMAYHTGEKPHQCPHCDYTAVQNYNVKTHIMARHAGVKPYRCPHCDYTALKNYSVKIHIMARHTDDKPHQCPHCDYKSVTISCLKKHIMAYHTGERPHQCPHCVYKSVTINCLKEHIMARHLGEKPHQCPHCDYRATQRSNLKTHIKYVHMYLNG